MLPPLLSPPPLPPAAGTALLLIKNQNLATLFQNMGGILYLRSSSLLPGSMLAGRLRSLAATALPGTYSPKRAIATMERPYSRSPRTTISSSPALSQSSTPGIVLDTTEKREAMKLIDKIGDQVGFSFEFFTPKHCQNSSTLTDSFLTTVAQMASHGPNFCGMMWRHTDPYPPLTLELASKMQNHLNIDILLHLTCVNMPLHRLNHALNLARSLGIRNILALRGDIPTTTKHTPAHEELSCALDLVRHIRAHHGDYFCIAVAGYPEAHPCKIAEGATTTTVEGYESDLQYLKSKVDAGAEVIISQLFLDVEVFLKFERDCRRIGIRCPVVPGILPITTYRNYKLMMETCRIAVPAEVKAAVEATNGDDMALAAYGVELATKMCRILLESRARQLHFYTMNKEGPVVAVLRNLGLVGE